jgi:hypothetical protein
MDLQQKSWFSEVRTTSLDGGSVVVGCDKELDSPGRSSLGAEERAPPYAFFVGWGFSVML